MQQRAPVPWGTASRAWLHSLTGCAVGEITGMAIGTAVRRHDVPTMVTAIALSFVVAFLVTTPVNR